MKRFVLGFLIFSTLFFFSTYCSFSFNGSKEKIIIIETTLGTIRVKLYNETPLHRDNFIKLVKEGYYNGQLFHRVINDFMIQAGDPATRTNFTPEEKKNHGPGYTIPAEFNPSLFHKKGVIAAAREGDNINPWKKSSGSQFYIVQGKIFTGVELDQIEKRINDQNKQTLFFKYINEEKEKAFANEEVIDYAKIQQAATLRLQKDIKNLPAFSIPPEQRYVYKSLGGTPHLDDSYTVFGEVVEGIEIIDKIAGVKTSDNDKPLTDVFINKMKLSRSWF
ncbi:MAG: peptidylprolyl isomerase [Bacteroidales bacterium]|nr:peptidylprolyl isomerase [Bacteroidales bacterium]